MSGILKVTIYVALVMAAASFCWVLGGVAHVWFWHPERVIPDKMWTLAQGVVHIVEVLIGVVVGVLVKSQAK